MKRHLLLVTAALAAVALVAQRPANMPESSFANPWANPDNYYLKRGEAPNSLLILPTVPMPGTTLYEHDEAMYYWGITQRKSPRGQQAIEDSNIEPDGLAKAFSEAFGTTISPEHTPMIYALISKMRMDAGALATNDAKDHYMRMRPYMVYGQPTNIPWDEEELSKNGSYPSGHSCTGMAVALVLMEINPARQNEIFLRGYEMGQSRVIAGFHYQSDVDAGRLCAAAIVARLHAAPGFQEALQKAKDEFAGLK